MKYTKLIAIIFVMAKVLCDEGPILKSKLLLQPGEFQESETTKTSKAFRYMDLKNLRYTINDNTMNVLPGKKDLKSDVTIKESKNSKEEEEDDFDTCDDIDNTEVDTDEFTESVPLSTTIISKKSYVDQFFIFLKNENNSVSAAENKGIVNKYIDPKSTEGMLKSKIKSYGNLISNDKDLKQYTELLVKENSDEDPKYDDITYKKYGPNRSLSQNSKLYKASNLSDIDIDKFCSYLRSQGFSDTELGFLFKQNLNYGFDEIESELKKIEEERSKKAPTTIIQIGGEEGIANNANGKPTAKLHYILISLYIISFVHYKF
ncbi:hypothetical protein CLIB1423_04S04082 [[Candida] railenensis]|uniref:Uncharacterized protein n=1 Tax=[Candida] railenensis TaxID=45579 RepID=A0A9P0QNM9_9ASCO|nr:hypothetical protein CLIB1423_04S04082 [[Candida] railenensis]